MAIEHTFSIIKPNAIAKNAIGSIIQRFESRGLIIIGAKMLRLTREQAEGFYAEHRGKIFFNNLIEFMISGPILAQVLEGEDAVYCNRAIIGATNPAHAMAGTIRAEYGDSVIENAIHGSDSMQSAIYEISYFFASTEIYARFL